MTQSSVIGQTTVIRGNVRGEGSIEVLGRVEGDVITDGDVVVGDRATVLGNISGAALRVGGVVSGDLTGSEAVVLTQTAQVTGDLRAPRLGIAEGAAVRGSVQTDTASAAPAPRAAPVRASAEPERQRPAPRAEAPAPAPRRPAPPPPAKKPAPRRAPPPVVPALAKGTRGRKKKSRGR